MRRQKRVSGNQGKGAKKPGLRLVNKRHVKDVILLFVM